MVEYQSSKAAIDARFEQEQEFDGSSFLWYPLDRFAMRNLSHKALSMKSIRHALMSGIASVFLLTFLSTVGFTHVIDGIAIIVNEDAVLVSEVNEAMMPLMREYRIGYAGAELKEKMAELRDTVIQQAIETKLILQVAKANGITASDKAIDTRIKAAQDRFSSEDEFLMALKVKGITYREYREQVAEQVLVQETIKRVIGTESSVLENNLQEYYENHPDEFVTEARVRLAQIFLGVPSGSTVEEIDEVRQKAEQIRALIDGGADFSELATEYSQGPYRNRDGVIGIVGPGEILPELEETVFKLSAGEISDVKQTTYGFHILRALEVAPARKIGFEEAKPFIEERLKSMRQNEKFEEWMENLKKDAFIEIKI